VRTAIAVPAAVPPPVHVGADTVSELSDMIQFRERLVCEDSTASVRSLNSDAVTFGYVSVTAGLPTVGENRFGEIPFGEILKSFGENSFGEKTFRRKVIH
jgi:hypothetical protein